MAKSCIYFYKAPCGNLEIKMCNQKLLSIRFVDHFLRNKSFPEEVKKIFDQLDNYFFLKKKSFSIDIVFNKRVSVFQKKVFSIIKNIKYGTTLSYKDISEKLGNANLSRAVGLACSKNPFLIAIPCHRVISTSGKISGFAGGVEIKKWLLKHENDNFKIL